MRHYVTAIIPVTRGRVRCRFVNELTLFQISFTSSYPNIRYERFIATISERQIEVNE